MPKLKTIFICSKCWEKLPKWSWQCPVCKSWNSIIEDVIDEKEEKNREIKEIKVSKISDKILKLWEKKDWEKWKERIKTWIWEFDRVLGWGFIWDSIILLTWDPWVWKSTLTLQVAWKIADLWKKVFYFSWEESFWQVSDRAKRIFWNKIPEVNFVSSSDLEEIFWTIEKFQPEFVIIDSINTIQSEFANWSAWSISQVKFCSEMIMHFFKKIWIPVLLIWHVTKWWEMAWPQVLAHLVDVVLHFEWEKYNTLKILRWIKNRFWATSEIWIFEMEWEWLKEVKNANEIFLNWKTNSEWSAITVTLEWTRPFIAEIQSLVNFTNFPYPKRVSSWIELNRLNIQIAILSKHCNLKLDNCDVFVSTVWWFKLNEPACDLAICASIISSKNKKIIPQKTVFLWEVSLSWEVRIVSHLEKRIKELEKLWFENLVCGKISDKIRKNLKSKINLIELNSIKDIFKIF